MAEDFRLQPGKSKGTASIVVSMSLLGLLLAGAAWIAHPAGVLTAGSTVETVDDYLGKEVCQDCHEERAQQHTGSNFEGSWRRAASLENLEFEKSVQEGPNSYAIVRKAGGWFFTLQMPDHPLQEFPIHSVIGGERFGRSLILRVEQIEERRLPRPTLIEARYLIEAGSGKLKLSPGFPAEVPGTYQNAIGRVLSPSFEQKCLDCHGGFSDLASAAPGEHPLYRDTGVSCERCHGPGRGHLQALEEDSADLAIIHPGKLSHQGAMQLCGQCHSGFFPIARPRPSDLLISNQANALSLSQCFIQSDGGFSCISCHDPHSNAQHDDPKYDQTCRQCHAESVTGSVLCPVNRERDCTDCHMPTVDKPGNFKLKDHWIRVVAR